jgi:hypothetical protein
MCKVRSGVKFHLRCYVIRLNRLLIIAFAIASICSGARMRETQQFPQNTYQEMRWRNDRSDSRPHSGRPVDTQDKNALRRADPPS